MKVLITGASGLLGHDLWKLLELKHELVALGRTRASWIDPARYRECDLTNAARTYTVITKENPEVVIHAAAYNNVDGAESEPDAAYKGNALATRNIAIACQRFDTTLITLSTDYVFDGSEAPDTGYREFDPCRPVNTYAQSKRWGELYVQQLLSKYFIVRTSWLFGPSRTTWVDRVAESAQHDKPIDAAQDMVSAPTYTPDLAQAVQHLCESRHYGLYHITNAGFCSRVELAQGVLKINKIGSEKSIRKMKLADLRLPAKRPHFSGLDNLAWRLDGFPVLRPWQEALQDHFSRKKVATR